MSELKSSFSFTQSLDEALPLMPRHRERNKRNRSLTLDDLIDEQRLHNRMHGSSLDLLLMSYRYQEAFNREQKLFLKRSLKPSKALDLWQLIFTALITRDHSSESATIYQSLEYAKKQFGVYMVGALRSFCQRMIEKKQNLRESIAKNPEVLLPETLIKRWSQHPFMNLSDIAKPLSQRPESGISAFDETLKWEKHTISDFKNQKLQALNEGSWLYLEYLFNELQSLSKTKNILKLLDTCAAPGGKLIGLLQWARKNKIEIKAFATEAKFKRMERLNENLKTWNLNATTYLHAWGEGAKLPWTQESWDILLIDLPCSGSGTLSQRPDLLEKDWSALLPEINSLQEKILTEIMSFSFEHAFISVCSIDPEEVDFISRLLKATPIFYSSKTHGAAMEHIVAWKISKNPLS